MSENRRGYFLTHTVIRPFVLWNRYMKVHKVVRRGWWAWHCKPIQLQQSVAIGQEISARPLHGIKWKKLHTAVSSLFHFCRWTIRLPGNLSTVYGKFRKSVKSRWSLVTHPLSSAGSTARLTDAYCPWCGTLSVVRWQNICGASLTTSKWPIRIFLIYVMFKINKFSNVPT